MSDPLNKGKTIDLGIFAHNEEDGIADMIGDLAHQTILIDPDVSMRVFLLANGCRDETVARADAAASGTALQGQFEIIDLPEGGKSRTWNRFVHEVSRSTADILIFADADIALPDPATLRRLCAFLSNRPDLVAVSSRPVKDITHAAGVKLSVSDRMTAAAGGTLNDWKRSICGQLYAMRADRAASFHLPIGLPVEDGFVRAMITTDVMREPPVDTRIDGREDIFHVYASERGIGPLLNHATRIVIGSAINAVLFGHLRRPGLKDPQRELEEAAQDSEWLSGILDRYLPKASSGYVPWHFLFKRISRLRMRNGVRRNIVLVVGFGFDAVVWIMAQMRMARGAGAGYW